MQNIRIIETNNFQNAEIRTADILNNDPNFFRGLSTFEFEAIPSIEPKEEKTDMSGDLADQVLQQQSKAIAKKAKENNEHKQLNKENFDKNQMNPESPSDTMSDSLENAIRIGQKRLSTSSTSSSTVLKKRRGRKPNSSTNTLLRNSLENINNKPLSKRDQIIEQAIEKGSKVVCFGNKVVEKDTDEYKKRRSSNNDAVKKCRQKLAEEQREKEERMKLLEEENKRLTTIVESLGKEMSVLKNIITQMSPNYKLSENLENLIKHFEET